MAEEDEINWVERRAWRQRHLANGAHDIWARVRSSIESACESYRSYYCLSTSPEEIFCGHENGKKIIVRRTFYPDGVRRFQQSVAEIIIKFCPDPLYPKIEAIFEDRIQSFSIEADENRAFLENDKTPDMVSRQILEPLLFPSDEKRVPAFPQAVFSVPPLPGSSR